MPEGDRLGLVGGRGAGDMVQLRVGAGEGRVQPRVVAAKGHGDQEKPLSYIPHYHQHFFSTLSYGGLVGVLPAELGLNHKNPRPWLSIKVGP